VLKFIIIKLVSYCAKIPVPLDYPTLL